MSEASPAIETTASAPAVLRGPGSGPARTLWGDAWRRFRKHKLAMFGAIVLLVFILCVLIIPLIRPVDPEALDFDASGVVFSWAHPMGADDLGRDLFARALFGGRISIAVGLVAMLIAITLGTAIGAMAGFFGGLADNLLMRVTDLFLALPQLPLLLLIVYLFREPVYKIFGVDRGIFLMVVTVIGALNWMTTARIVRGAFLSLKQKEFVEAATALGVKNSSIMFRHILPNAFSPIIVAATLEVGSAIITESVLSFLGVGFPPDTPTWGRLIFDAKDYLATAPHMVLWPGALIFFTVLSINYVGDGLRDALDPRSRL